MEVRHEGKFQQFLKMGRVQVVIGDANRFVGEFDLSSKLGLTEGELISFKDYFAAYHASKDQHAVSIATQLRHPLIEAARQIPLLGFWVGVMGMLHQIDADIAEELMLKADENAQTLGIPDPDSIKRAANLASAINEEAAKQARGIRHTFIEERLGMIRHQ